MQACPVFCSADWETELDGIYAALTASEEDGGGLMVDRPKDKDCAAYLAWWVMRPQVLGLGGAAMAVWWVGPYGGYIDTSEDLSSHSHSRQISPARSL